MPPLAEEVMMVEEHFSHDKSTPTTTTTMHDYPLRRNTFQEQQYSCLDCKKEDIKSIRAKQKRLLLVRHATKCRLSLSSSGSSSTTEDYCGRKKCPIPLQCAKVKRLCAHIVTCKDDFCTFPHCVSTRYIISHHQRCKDMTCAVCIPVKKCIQKSNTRKMETLIRHNESSRTMETF